MAVKENNKLSFAVENISLLEEPIDKSQFALLRVDAFATGKSLHDTYVSEEVLRKTAPTILHKPFVFAVDKRFDDLAGHERDEIVGGFVPANSPIEFVKLEDGRTMLSCNVLVWRRYSGKLLEYFERDGHRKGVSVEIEIYKQEDRPDGLTELLDFAYFAITALGDLIRSAIPNAQAILQFSKEYDEAVELEFGHYEDVDFKIPRKVKKNAEKALDLYKQHNKGGNSQSLANARYLVSKDAIEPNRIRKIATRKPKNTEIDDETSEDYISNGLWGGAEAWLWANKIVEKLNELDDKTLSYFDDKNEIENNKSNDNNLVKEEVVSVTDKIKEKEEFSEKENDLTPENLEASDTPINTEVENKEFAEGEEEGKEKEEDKEDGKDKSDDKEEKEDDEEKKEEYSLSSDLNVTEALAFLASETEDYQALAKEFSEEGGKNFAAMACAIFAKAKETQEMCNKYAAEKEEMLNKMAQQEEGCKVHMAELEELRSYKADKEQEQFNFAVDATLKAIEEKTEISADELESLKEKSKEFSLETLDAWKNLAKARGLDFAVKDKQEDDGIKRYGLPFTKVNSRGDNGSPWERS